MNRPDPATAAQLRALDPGQSTWLSANAGSGKTRVLTDRVALLLFGGTDPQNILCLTYTKAAAAEMQNRLFKRLGEWAMMPDTDLRRELAGLGVAGALDRGRLADARTLFAAAIETPGGLRIQTIHSFCASLLRRFPLEARVSPLFRELDDRAATDLYRDVLRQMAGGGDAGIVSAMAGHVSDLDLVPLAKVVASKRAAFRRRRSEAEIRAAYGLGPRDSGEATIERLTGPERVALLREAIPVLQASTANDQKVAARLLAAGIDGPGAGRVDVLFDVFLTGKDTRSPFSAKTGAIPVRDTRDAHPGLAARLAAYMEEIEAARAVIMAERAVPASLALEDFAHVFLDRYADAKARGGWLDFDDLIEKAAAILDDDAVSAWIMYRLDGGIDHILVDEAQDTSPAQWRIIRLLAREFGTDSQDTRRRTVFVVGDKKQSIYSFQGADPAEFDHMRDHFKRRLNELAQPFQPRELHYSFRSSPAILDMVDQVFGGIGGGVFEHSDHKAHKADMPGRVDIWPVRHEKADKSEIAWDDPQDILAPHDDKVVLADRIAQEIATLLAEGSLPDGKGNFRAILPGDFLILVQRRSELFHEIIRACKARGLPIAGADLMKVGAELAVKDLTALLSFLALPQDSLSLAAFLRSPMGGFDEQALFDLAHRRGQNDDLWDALDAKATAFPEAHAMLTDLRARADFLMPYELLERALTRWGGRVQLLARLGAEAEEGIDALLTLARDYEATGPASLTGFLAWLDRDETQIKRQAETAGDKIRVMTTHGAKGLESGIVILPETQEIRPQPRMLPRLDADGAPYWPAPAGAKTARDDAAEAASQAAREAERLRLLYVAMTRAEKWLIVCGAGQSAGKDDSWHSRIHMAAETLGAEKLDIPGLGTGLRYQFGEWGAVGSRAEPATPEAVAVPEWARLRAPPPPPRLQIVNPSKLGQVKSLAGPAAAGDRAARRGSLIHELLEALPPLSLEARASAAADLAASHFPDLPEPVRAQAISEALGVLADPAVAHIFAADTFAEIAISAPHKPNERIAGVIDRLIIGHDRVLVIDFKTNAQVPATPGDIPDGILLQMSAYLAAVSRIYPEKRVDLAILWTVTRELMPIPHEIVSKMPAPATTP